jgi:hypothetical protein
MQTRGTIFETYAAVAGHQRDVVLKITQGASSWLFSMRPMPQGLDSAPIYPLLLSHSPVSEGFSIFTKQPRISNVKFTMSDKAFYPSNGGRPQRISKLLEGINGATCEVFYWVDGITDIDDCLRVFDGYVLEALVIKKSVVSFTGTARGKLWDTVLPDRIIKNYYATAAQEVRTIPIPWVYGSFDGPDLWNDNANATGLCKAIARDAELSSRYIIADHAIDALNAEVIDARTFRAYVDVGAPTLLLGNVGANYNLNDSGIAWCEPSLDRRLYIQFNDTLPGIYTNESYVESASERANLVDDDYNTYCRFKDRYTDDGTYVEGLAMWGVMYSHILRAHLENGGYVRAGYRNVVDDQAFSTYMTDLRIALYYGTAGGDENVVIAAANSTGAGDPTIFTFGSSSWNWAGADSVYERQISDINSDDPGDELAIHVYWRAGGVGSPANSTVGDQYIIKAGDMMLRYRYIDQQFRDHVWVACDGLAYGSLARAGNGYSAGNPIEDPAIMIESLFREALGLVDADIDMPSFDNAANSNVEARINITEKRKLSEIARTLSEQSTCVNVIATNGKLRCIALNDKDPTLNAIIRRADLVNDDFTMTKTNHIVNEMKVSSRWQAEYTRFLDLIVYEDATSQAAFKERLAEYEWKNILGTSAAHVAQHYVNTTDGIWSKEHVVVAFTTPGFMHAHLQAGDWIAFNDDIDDIRTAFGVTWAGKKLLVADIARSESGTTITALELYEDLVPGISPSPSP